MKKHILTAAICACLTVFASCGGSSKQGTTDSSAVTQDTAGTNSGGNMPADSGATGTGQTQSQGGGTGSGAATGSGGGTGSGTGTGSGSDTSGSTQKPVASPGGTPQ